MPKISELTSQASPVVGDSIPIVHSGATEKATLGALPISTATQAALDLKTTNTAAAITGGTITGITDLAVVDGGTGASTAGAARTNLGSTATGDSLFTAATAAAAKVVVDASAPAFSAYQSAAQNLAQNVITKLQFQTEEFDTAGAFDAATNYRFLPLVGGYYQISGGFSISTTQTGLNLYLYKNGAVYKNLVNLPSNASSGAYGAALVFLNGTTDYIELFGKQGAPAQNVVALAAETYFQGTLMRAA